MAEDAPLEIASGMSMSMSTSTSTSTGTNTSTTSEGREPSWTLLSSHGAVFFYLAARPDSTLRAMSDALGLTERRIARIVKDLIDAGMIEARRQGRRNFYTVNPEAHFRHGWFAHIPVRQMISTVVAMMNFEENEPGVGGKTRRAR
jgi:hypothetical protein